MRMIVIIDMFSPGVGVLVLYTKCSGLTRRVITRRPGSLFRFRNPVTGVTLIIYLIRVIYEMPELHEMLDALVHHGARDA